MRDRTASVGIIASGEGPVERFKAGMSEHNFVEGRNIRFETRLARGDSRILTNLAQQLVDQRVDLIAVVGAVGARAARSVTSSIPIVYAVVVDPAGDGLATSGGHPLPNMTGVTTFDAAQAQVQLTLLRSIKPELTNIAYLADPAVSDCLANANLRVAREAGLCAGLLHVVGPDPDLDGAFAQLLQERAQAIVALEHPAIGANARQIAERARTLNVPTVFARDQALLGGLFGYGTSLGAAAHAMTRQVSRVLGGEAPADIAVETFRLPELVVNMTTARHLGLTVPPAFAEMLCE